jgi:predicted ribosome quality control (RQC) complex YloA/Tae2 family protein
MAMDNITLSLIVSSLRKELVSASFGKPLALSLTDFGYPYSEILPDGTIRHGTFVFSMNPTTPFLSYSHDRYEKVDDNTAFFASLKKLALGTVTDVRKLPGERVVTISVKANSSDISEINSGYDLILELFPNHPNAYIIAYPYQKIVSLYKEFTNLEKGVFVARNTEYSYPPERKMLSLDLTSLEETKPYLTRSLYKKLEEYVGKGHGFQEALKELLESKDLYCLGKDILPFSFGHEDARKISPDQVYSSLVSDQKEAARKAKEKALLSLIEHAIKVSEKKTKNLTDDLKTANENLKYLEYGQEIYVYQAEIRKGDKILVKDGYSIPLDPRLSVSQNAGRYFKKYSKAKAALSILAELIEKCKDETLYLKRCLLSAENGTPRDILELKSELLTGGYIREQKGQNHVSPVSKRKTYDPHFLTLEKGKIGYGMNGLQNEELTFHVAQKDDIFVHVKDAPGAHVVILEGAENEDVRTTAYELALYLSHFDNGTVMIAKRKDVKKNPNKIGLVNVLKYTSVEVKYIRASSLALFRKRK